MLNVLIIDDDLKDSKDLEKLCIHYFNKRNIDYKINIELKLNENLDIFSNVDILFLDVEIGNNNGIEFSKRLRKVYPELIVERQILHKSQLHFKLQSEYIVDRV